MIRHIVWWTLKDEAEGATAAQNGLKIKALIEALRGKIDTLKSVEVSVKLAATTTVDAQVVLHSTHDTVADLAAYNDHPEHQKIVGFIKKVVSSRQAIDFEV
jgi:hypothetical protein